MPHWKIVVLIVALGVRGGRLSACPSTPNCVCSQDSEPSHTIEPFTFKGDADEAWAKLKDIVAHRPRTRVVTATETYLHAEGKSRIFGFVDDVEFLLDRDAGLIHVRSASRAGRSDLGVNRHRVEEIRKAFATP